jgi:hypothetical protein
MRLFFTCLKPEDGIDIKMDQPGGTLALLTDFFLVAVFYGRKLIAGSGCPVVMA